MLLTGDIQCGVPRDDFQPMVIAFWQVSTPTPPAQGIDVSIAVWSQLHLFRSIGLGRKSAEINDPIHCPGNEGVMCRRNQSNIETTSLFN